MPSLFHCRFSESPNNYIVFELAQTDLFDVMQDQDPSEIQCQGYVVDICLALEHVHSLLIVHCDVKLENMLLVDGRIKLCDFGYAAPLHLTSLAPTSLAPTSHLPRTYLVYVPTCI